ncbi:MAG: agmatinase [Nitrospinae bacterium]|nr:agmatinase [Nitrospinota bacterium]
MGGEARPRYLCAGSSFESARVVLLGCPFDGTASHRRGARLGPDAMREASDCLETYSPGLDKDLADAALCDLGDVDFPSGDTKAVLAAIKAEACRIFRSGKRPVFLGGEHLVSLPLVEAALGVFPGLAVFQWDAHADLREDYLGVRLSHACAMRRILEFDGVGPLRQFGVRSGTREEFAWMRANDALRPLTPEAVSAALKEAGDSAVYLTVDVDVVNPGEMPGTGSPEPGGPGLDALVDCIRVLDASGARIVGADVVELAPEWDPTGASAIAAAKIVRELALVMGA